MTSANSWSPEPRDRWQWTAPRPHGALGWTGYAAAALAIAWVLAQGDTIVPIPGTRKIARLEENVGALDVTLTNDDLAAIEAASPANAVSGLRYPEQAMSSVNI